MISPRAFIAGFLTVATLLLLLTCSQNDSGTNPVGKAANFRIFTYSFSADSADSLRR